MNADKDSKLMLFCIVIKTIEGKKSYVGIFKSTKEASIDAESKVTTLPFCISVRVMQ